MARQKASVSTKSAHISAKQPRRRELKGNTSRPKKTASAKPKSKPVRAKQAQTQGEKSRPRQRKAGPVKPHRFRPGTQARFKVRRLQKSVVSHCSTSGFRRMFVSFVDDTVPMRVSALALRDAQDLVEAEVMRIANNAIERMRLCGKQRLTSGHVLSAARERLRFLPGNASIFLDQLTVADLKDHFDPHFLGRHRACTAERVSVKPPAPVTTTPVTPAVAPVDAVQTDVSH